MMNAMSLISLLLLTAFSSSFRYTGQTRIGCCIIAKRGGMCSFANSNGVPMYDGFESDPILMSKLKEEISIVKRLKSCDIKSELCALNQPSSDIFDRDDLIRRLATLRIKQQLVDEATLSQRQIKAYKLQAEIESVSSLSDEQILRGLHLKNVNINSVVDREQLVRKLAMVNVDLGPAPSEPKAKNASTNTKASSSVHTAKSSLVDEAKYSLMEGVKGVAGAAHVVQEKLKEPIATAQKEAQVFSKTFSDSISSARNFSSSVAYTRSELIARDVLDGTYSPPSQDPPETRYEKSMEVLLSEAMNFNTFDDVYFWALSMPRATVARLLEMRGMVIPKYAPLSALSSFLADSIMAEKTELSLLNRSGDNLDASNTQDSRWEKASGTRPRVMPVARPPRVSAYDAYEPERLLVEQIRSKLIILMTSTIPGVFQKVFNVENIEGVIRSTVSAIVASPVSFSLGALLKISAAAGIEIADKLGRWAGGNVITSAQALFLACMYCIVARRGVLSFAGALAAIRITRIVATNPGQNSQIGDKDNQAKNVATNRFI